MPKDVTKAPGLQLPEQFQLRATATCLSMPVQASPCLSLSLPQYRPEALILACACLCMQAIP